jgi:hypothetical protein
MKRDGFSLASILPRMFHLVSTGCHSMNDVSFAPPFFFTNELALPVVIIVDVSFSHYFLAVFKPALAVGRLDMCILSVRF